MKTQQNTYFTGLQVLTCKDSNGKHTNRQKNQSTKKHPGKNKSTNKIKTIKKTPHENTFQYLYAAIPYTSEDLRGKQIFRN